jgi:hypothetical protein
MLAMIVLLATQGGSNDRIAAQLGLPRQIASEWRQKCRGCDQGAGL